MCKGIDGKISLLVGWTLFGFESFSTPTRLIRVAPFRLLDFFVGYSVNFTLFEIVEQSIGRYL